MESFGMLLMPMSFIFPIHFLSDSLFNFKILFAGTPNEKNAADDDDCGKYDFFIC